MKENTYIFRPTFLSAVVDALPVRLSHNGADPDHVADAGIATLVIRFSESIMSRQTITFCLHNDSSLRDF
jgi:hypothetical protein